MKLNFILNEKEVSVDTNPLRRLLDVLRDDLKCKDVKEGCSEGECGACSVLLDGKIVTSCLIPVGAVNGQKIMTSGYITSTEKGKLIADAFADAGAVQCGFCIPGMVVAVYNLLSENSNPSEDDIRLGISGNICRCTGYDLIVEAVKLAVKRGGEIWKK